MVSERWTQSELLPSATLRFCTQKLPNSDERVDCYHAYIYVYICTAKWQIKNYRSIDFLDGLC